MSRSGTSARRDDGLYEQDHELFRETARAFIEREMVPHHLDWEAAGIVDRSLFRAAGESGLIGLQVPEEFGGGGTTDFRFNAVLGEEAAYADVMSSYMALLLHNDVCTPYLADGASREQAHRWLPGVSSGELITAIAMTEPGAGSDLAGMRTTAVRDGDHYVVNGTKMFISNGINADLVIVAVRTDIEDPHGGLSLLVVERDTPGFKRGRNLEKVGLHAQDTAELWFDNARVPVANLLGEEGSGFQQLVEHLPQERLAVAVIAVAQAQRAFELALDHASSREAFEQRLTDFQNTRFVLADMSTEIDAARALLERHLRLHVYNELSPVEAAKCKYYSTELFKRVVDRCVQIFGGYGYMTEHPIARLYADARIYTIFAGTSEIMKEIIGRDLTKDVEQAG